MTTQVQLRRGNNDDHQAFIGAPGEITVNTSNMNIHVHDGVKYGGHPLANRPVIAFTSDATAQPIFLDGQIFYDFSNTIATSSFFVHQVDDNIISLNDIQIDSTGLSVAYAFNITTVFNVDTEFPDGAIAYGTKIDIINSNPSTGIFTCPINESYHTRNLLSSHNSDFQFAPGVDNFISKNRNTLSWVDSYIATFSGSVFTVKIGFAAYSHVAPLTPVANVKRIVTIKNIDKFKI